MTTDTTAGLTFRLKSLTNPRFALSSWAAADIIRGAAWTGRGANKTIVIRNVEMRPRTNALGDLRWETIVNELFRRIGGERSSEADLLVFRDKK